MSVNVPGKDDLLEYTLTTSWSFLVGGKCNANRTSKESVNDTVPYGYLYNTSYQLKINIRIHTFIKSNLKAICNVHHKQMIGILPQSNQTCHVCYLAIQK